jgi:hypothetical protein
VVVQNYERIERCLIRREAKSIDMGTDGVEKLWRIL